MRIPQRIRHLEIERDTDIVQIEKLKRAQALILGESE
jgi:hypothetical protein